MKENDLKHICLYCGTERQIDEWETVYSMERHYKIIKCHECNRTEKIEVHFESSGHDSWTGKAKDPENRQKTERPEGSITVVDSPLEKAIKEFSFAKK